MHKNAWIESKSKQLERELIANDGKNTQATIHAFMTVAIAEYEHSRRDWMWDEAMKTMHNKDKHGRTQF